MYIFLNRLIYIYEAKTLFKNSSSTISTKLHSTRISELAKRHCQIAIASAEMLNDSLSPIPMRTPDGHMHISVDQHATPHQEVVARRIPLRYKPQRDSVVQDLIDKNVITSPAFFVPKPDGIHMRLVTDYTKLNRFVHRPIHPFPSTRDILQSIPHGQNLFAKLDTVHGYFQLCLLYTSPSPRDRQKSRMPSSA